MSNLYLCKFKALEFVLDKTDTRGLSTDKRVKEIVGLSGGTHLLATVQGWKVLITLLPKQKIKFEMIPPYSNKEMVMTSRQYNRFQDKMRALAIDLLGESIKITRGGNLTLTEGTTKKLSDSLQELNTVAELALDHEKAQSKHREDVLVFKVMPAILTILILYVIFKFYS